LNDMVGTKEAENIIQWQGNILHLHVLGLFELRTVSVIRPLLK